MSQGEVDTGDSEPSQNPEFLNQAVELVEDLGDDPPETLISALENAASGDISARDIAIEFGERNLEIDEVELDSQTKSRIRTLAEALTDEYSFAPESVFETVELRSEEDVLATVRDIHEGHEREEAENKITTLLTAAREAGVSVTTRDAIAILEGRDDTSDFEAETSALPTDQHEESAPDDESPEKTNGGDLGPDTRSTDEGTTTDSSSDDTPDESGLSTGSKLNFDSDNAGGEREQSRNSSHQESTQAQESGSTPERHAPSIIPPLDEDSVERPSSNLEAYLATHIYEIGTVHIGDILQRDNSTQTGVSDGSVDSSGTQFNPEPDSEFTDPERADSTNDESVEDSIVSHLEETSPDNLSEEFQTVVDSPTEEENESIGLDLDTEGAEIRVSSPVSETTSSDTSPPSPAPSSVEEESEGNSGGEVGKNSDESELSQSVEPKSTTDNQQIVSSEDQGQEVSADESVFETSKIPPQSDTESTQLGQESETDGPVPDPKGGFDSSSLTGDAHRTEGSRPEAREAGNSVLNIPNYAQDTVDLKFVFDEDDPYLPDDVDASGMVAIDDETYAAITRVKPRNWSILTNDSKHSIIRTFQSSFLLSLDFDIQIKCYSTEFRINDHIETVEATSSPTVEQSDDSPPVAYGRRFYPNWLREFITSNDISQREFYVIVTVSKSQIAEFQDRQALINSLKDTPAIGEIVSQFSSDPTEEITRLQCLRELSNRMEQVKRGLGAIDVEVDPLEERDEALSVIYQYLNDQKPLEGTFSNTPYTSNTQSASGIAFDDMDTQEQGSTTGNGVDESEIVVTDDQSTDDSGLLDPIREKLPWGGDQHETPASEKDIDLGSIDDNLMTKATEELQGEGREITPDALKQKVVELQRQEEDTDEHTSVGIELSSRVRERTVNRAVAPEKIDDAEDMITRVGADGNKRYVREFIIQNLPDSVSYTWLDSLFTGGLETDGAHLNITYQISPYETTSVLSQLESVKGSLKSKKRGKLKKGKINIEEENAKISDIERITTDLKTSSTKLFDFGLYVEVVAESEEALFKGSKEVRQLLKREKTRPVPLYNRQLDEMRTMAPFGRDFAQTTYPIDVQALSRSMPFIDPSVIHPEGVLVGIQESTASPTIVDRFELSGFNWLISGKIGSGKTYLSKLLNCRRYFTDPDTEILIIDPRNEFTDLVRSLDGQIVKFDSGTIINPLEIKQVTDKEALEEMEGHPYTTKINSVVGLLKAHIEDRGTLSKEEEGVLRRAVRFAYLGKGIVKDVETHGNESPIIQDVIDILEHIEQMQDPKEFLDVPAGMEEYISEIQSDTVAKASRSGRSNDRVADWAQNVRLALEDFQPGGQRANLNGQSNVSLDSQVVQFDLTSIPKDDNDIYMHIMLDWLFQRAKANSGRKLVTIDEAHELLDKKMIRQSMNTFVRNSRHYTVGLNLISQTVDEYLKYDSTKEMYDQFDCRALMRHEDLGDAAVESLGLTPAEQQYVLRAQPGRNAEYSQCLLYVSEIGKMQLQIYSSPFEDLIINREKSAYAYLYDRGLISQDEIPKHQRKRVKQALDSPPGQDDINYRI